MKMKKIFYALILSAFIFSSCEEDDKSVDLALSFNGKLTEANTEFPGDPNGEAVGDYYTKAQFTDNKNIISFDNYTASWGFGGGFLYTNKTDVTTSGYTNNSAITGKGINGDTYLTSKTDEFTPALFTINNPAIYKIKGAYVTNSTYAYLAIKNGDNAKKFGGTSGTDEDWFKLTAIGYDANNNQTGTAEIYLADFRNSDSSKDYILKDWTWFDLTPLGNPQTVKFQMSSTDNNTWGMITPAYFSMDGITVTLL